MKRMLMLVVLMSLCAAAPASAVNPIPDLVGEWMGQVEIHHAAKGFITSKPGNVTFEIIEQVGHTFHGVKTWGMPDGTTHKESFSGVVSADGTHVYIAEHEDGLIMGDLISDTDMALYYLEHGDAPKAMFYELKRVK